MFSSLGFKFGLAPNNHSGVFYVKLIESYWLGIKPAIILYIYILIVHHRKIMI